MDKWELHAHFPNDKCVSVVLTKDDWENIVINLAQRNEVNYEIHRNGFGGSINIGEGVK